MIRTVCLAGLAACMALPAGSRAEARTVSIDFAAGVNATVRGVYVTKDYWFELSEDWGFIDPSVLDLRFSHSSILRKDLSSLTVQVNGSALQSIHLDPSNEKGATLVTRVPAKVLKGGMNVLSLTIKMRSELKDLCDDVHNPALWTLIEKESRLDVSFEEKKIEPDLAKFPSDYANPDLLYPEVKERVHAVIVVPDEPSPGEMEAVGALATLFGQEIGLGRGEFRVVSP
ncbi:MAG: cellulose biosynthesis cyclic di-GMP-binding regulatory protein BcsB, partial [Deltaproteobacteria bacterium]|nr:cellulose biosynthesis cyclic di-GMP-binding regulatory protein BcsB [Deltaproteobacteria bacterium]